MGITCMVCINVQELNCELRNMDLPLTNMLRQVFEAYLINHV